MGGNDGGGDNAVPHGHGRCTLRRMSELWTANSVPPEAYDRLHAQLVKAEELLGAIRDGKHSLPGTLVQIDRYFESRGRTAEPQKVPGKPFV